MADQKITALTAKTSALNTDILPIVEDPAGTPITKKITKEDLNIPTSVKITSDTSSNTTTTLANANGLLFAVKDGVYYKFKFMVLYRSAATTTGIILSVTIPNVTEFIAIADVPVSTVAAGTAKIIRGDIIASATKVTGTGTPTTTQSYLAEINGMILPSADGNVQVQFASEVAASGVTIKAGSHGLLWKL